MSYILDALKKAERERGTTQVPNLMTVHDFKAVPRHRGWILLVAVVVCAAGLSWYLLHVLRINVRHPASTSESRQSQQPTAPAAVDNPAPVPANIASTLKKNPPAAEMRATNGPVIPLARPSKPVGTGEVSPPGNDRSASLGSGGRGRIRSADGPNLPGSAITKPPEVNQIQPASPPAPRQTIPQQTVTPPAAPASLSEAVAMMNLSVLLYSDVPAERIAFINGRKYVEGDRIDGKYLIESITLEGAVLSYQGERATLRPRQQK